MNAWLIAWRNLKRRKLRTFLTALSIVIGVAATLGVVASVDSAKRAFPLYLKSAFGKADYTIGGTEAYFGEDALQAAQAVDRATAVGVLKENARLHIEREGLSDIQKRVDLSGYSDLNTPLTAFKVIDGTLSNDGAVITDRTARAWKAKVGDNVTFDTDDGPRSIAISAIVNYTVELMGPSSWTMAKFHPWSVAVPLPVMQDWFDRTGEIQSIQVRADREADLGTIGSKLEGIAKQYGDIYVQPVVIDFDTQFETVNTFYMLLYLAGFLGMALSAFIIFNSLFVSVKERRNEFAVLKTIGYTPGQLRQFVLIEVVLLSVIGTACGLLLGLGLAQLLQKVIFMVIGVYEEATLRLAPGLMLSILAGLIVPALAALYPIRHAGKTSVIAALSARENGEEANAKTKSARMLATISGLLLIAAAFFIPSLYLLVPFLLGVILVFPALFGSFMALLRPLYRGGLGFGGTMASRNLTRNRDRTAMTSVVLCLGITMIVLMGSLNMALVQSFEKVIYASYGGNLDVHLHHVEKTDLEQIRAVPGVAGAQTYALHAAVWKEDGQKRMLPVYGVGEDWIDRFPLFTSEDRLQSELIGGLKDDELALDRVAFGAWGGEIGDRITLETPQGDRSFKVVSVVDTMKNNGYGSFMRQSQFESVFGIKYVKNALIQKDDTITPLQLRERIFDLFGARVMEMFGPEDWVTVVGATYTGSFTVVNFLVVLAIVISGIGIANTLLMNIMERIRELGMMRAVGVSRRQVIRMIRLEGIGIGLAATIVGCALGIVLIYIASTFFEVRSLTYEFGVSWLLIGLVVMFGLLVSWLSSVAPASRAAKTELSEALRYE
ncbi:MAG: ABC transporter permease [Cohnella sp.]|nr:ABC transporter permease [Cohnella sp.]